MVYKVLIHNNGATPNTTAILLFTVIVFAISWANVSYSLFFNPFIWLHNVSIEPPNIKLINTMCAKKANTNKPTNNHSGNGNSNGISFGSGVDIFSNIT